MARTAIVFAALLFGAFADPWDTPNNPETLNPNQNTPFHYNAFALPTEGKTPTEPWSDTYWPSFESGVAHRWRSDNPQDFTYALNTLDQLRNMTSDEIAQLSPAEKLDIFNQRYDYPFVKSEWKRCRPDDPQWEGICHGWSPAALFYAQPDACTLTNADGVTIPFGSSDVKALLSYYVGEYDQQESSLFVGQRCNLDITGNQTAADTPACRDLNAGSYHVVIANLLGMQQKGFVVDRERGIQVWNQPLYSFATKVANVSAGQVQVHTSMSYAKETMPAWNKHPAYIMTEEYDYTMDVDQNSKITGGNMQSYDRVDFAWMDQIDPFYGYFANLKTIYAASTNSSEPVAASKRSAARRPNHHVLTGRTGAFSVGQYTGGHRASWSIRANGVSGIRVTFSAMDTERFRDKVRVYEGHNGEGALVAVLHGTIPDSIDINADSAYIVFKADRASEGHMGFSAEYTTF